MNGWQRLWLLSCVLWWATVIAYGVYIYNVLCDLGFGWPFNTQELVLALLVPCVGVYILGWAVGRYVAWIRKDLS